MKTTSKILVGIAILGAMAVGVATAADTVSPPQTWTPGWRHEQMIKAVKDGTAAPGPGYGYGMGPGMMGRGPMAAALGPDGKVDPDKLPEFCPMRQAPTK